jgi:hypothetical protein
MRRAAVHEQHRRRTQHDDDADDEWPGWEKFGGHGLRHPTMRHSNCCETC